MLELQQCESCTGWYAVAISPLCCLVSEIEHMIPNIHKTAGLSADRRFIQQNAARSTKGRSDDLHRSIVSAREWLVWAVLVDQHHGRILLKNSATQKWRPKTGTWFSKCRPLQTLFTERAVQREGVLRIRSTLSRHRVFQHNRRGAAIRCMLHQDPVCGLFRP